MKTLRKAAGFKTQDALAGVLNVDRTTVCKWELGETFPRAGQLPHIAEILGCTTSDIIVAINEAKERQDKTA